MMDYVRLATPENPKVQFDSIALLPRKLITPASTPNGAPSSSLITHLTPFDSLVLNPKEEYQCFLYVGMSDGCVTQYMCSVVLPVGAKAYEVNCVPSQRRVISEGVEGHVTYMALDTGFRDPRLVTLCDGRVTAMHYSTLDALTTFQAVAKQLEGATACCLAQGQENQEHRLAAVVKRQVVLVEFTDATSKLIPVAATMACTGENTVTQMGWHHHVVICGTKREYSLFDVRTGQLVDRVVVEKLAAGPLVRFLPSYLSPNGCFALRLTGDTVVLYDGSTRGPVDQTSRAYFSEPATDMAFAYPMLFGVKGDGRVLCRSLVDDLEVPSKTAGFGFGAACRSHAASVGGLLFGVTNLQLGVLVGSPPTVLVSQLVKQGAYDRAESHYEYYFLPAGTQPDERYRLGLRRIQHSCGVHALVNGNYEAAFRYFELAETPPHVIAGAVMELRRPSKEAASSRGDTVRDSASVVSDSAPATSSSNALHIVPPVSFKDNRDAYTLLFRYLRDHRDQPLPVVDTSPLTVQSPTTASSSADDDAAATVDFAMFLMLLQEKVEFTDDDLNDLFVPSCMLHVEECLPLVEAAAATLGPRHSFTSLLLASSGKVREALELCQRMQLVAEAIVPLQLSGDLSLYLDHLPWMLHLNPVVAVKALTQVKHRRLERSPPVDAVLPLLLPYSGPTLGEYLWFLIRQRRSRDGMVHTTYALNLVETISRLRLHRMKGFSEEVLRVRAGEEAGLVGETRRKLLQFLSSSRCYDVDVVIAAITKAGGLDDELVAAYRTSGDHDAALQVLVYKMHDVEAAEQYCLDFHQGKPYRGSNLNTDDIQTNSSSDQNGKLAPRSRTDPSSELGSDSGNRAAQRGRDFLAANASFGSSDSRNLSMPNGKGSFRRRPGAAIGTSGELSDIQNVEEGSDDDDPGDEHDAQLSQVQRYNQLLNHLLRVLLVPPSGEAQRVDDALRLLEVHAKDIDPVSVLEALPGDVAFTKIAGYLIRTMHTLTHNRLVSLAMAQSARSDLNNSIIERSLLQQRCVYVDEDRPCVVCKKPVGGAVMGVFPNLKVAHFRCFKDKELDPERGVPFAGRLL